MAFSAKAVSAANKALLSSLITPARSSMSQSIQAVTRRGLTAAPPSLVVRPAARFVGSSSTPAVSSSVASQSGVFGPAKSFFSFSPYHHITTERNTTRLVARISANQLSGSPLQGLVAPSMVRRGHSTTAASSSGGMSTIADTLPKLNSIRFARMPNRIDLDNFATALFALAFFWGGSTGTANGNMFADIALHDTYFVVGHFHFIAVVSVAAATLRGITNWSGNFISPFSHSLVRNPMTFLAAAATVVFASGLFLSMHAWGLEGHCRRVYDYTDTSNAPIIGTVFALAANISAVMAVYWLVNSI